MGIRSGWITGLLVVVVLAAAACGGSEESQPVVVGVGSTDEQRVLAALAVEALTRAGVPTTAAGDLGDTVALRRRAFDGDIDLFWDYTGAAWALGLGQQAPPADPVESYERVARADAEAGLVWLEPTQANATLALFVRSEDRPEPPGNTLSWLAGQLSAGDRPLCADPDFLDRPAGYQALAEEYAIAVERVDAVAASEDRAVAQVARGSCFAGLASATSGAAVAAGLARVTDDQRLFPAFVVAPVAAAEVMRRAPEVRSALADVSTRLSTQALAELNAQVVAGQDPQQVATAFLDAQAVAAAPDAVGT